MREEDKLPSTALLTIAEGEKELLNALATLIPAISHVNCWAKSYAELVRSFEPNLTNESDR